jgi:hypothetical protein
MFVFGEQSFPTHHFQNAAPIVLEYCMLADIACSQGDGIYSEFWNCHLSGFSSSHQGLLMEEHFAAKQQDRTHLHLETLHWHACPICIKQLSDVSTC